MKYPAIIIRSREEANAIANKLWVKGIYGGANSAEDLCVRITSYGLPISIYLVNLRQWGYGLMTVKEMIGHRDITLVNSFEQAVSYLKQMKS